MDHFEVFVIIVTKWLYSANLSQFFRNFFVENERMNPIEMGSFQIDELHLSNSALFQEVIKFFFVFDDWAVHEGDSPTQEVMESRKYLVNEKENIDEISQVQ